MTRTGQSLRQQPLRSRDRPARPQSCLRIASLIALASLSLPLFSLQASFDSSSIVSFIHLQLTSKPSVSARSRHFLFATMKAALSLVLPALAACNPVWVQTIHNDAAPVLSTSNADVIPDSYMVVFKSHVDSKKAAAHHSWVRDLHEASSAELRKRSQFPMLDGIYDGLKHSFHIPDGLMGYAGHFDESVLEQIRRHPDVSPRPATTCASDSHRYRLTTSSGIRSFTP